MRHLIYTFLSGIILAASVVAILFPIQGSPIPRLSILFSGKSGIWQNARASVVTENATITIAGTKSPVKIVKDSRGVPHIYAQSYEDALVGLGYVTAQDRFFQAFLQKL